MKKLLFFTFLFVILTPLFAERQLDIIEINGHECVANELIIKFKQDTERSDLIAQERTRLLSDYNAESKKKWITKAELWKVNTTKDTTLEDIINELKGSKYIEYVEPNYILYADAIPNDPSFNDQWGLHNTGQTGGTADADIDAPEAWDITTGDSTIVVGVIDTGIDYNHEDLQQNIWINPNEIPGNGIDDDNQLLISKYSIFIKVAFAGVGSFLFNITTLNTSNFGKICDSRIAEVYHLSKVSGLPTLGFEEADLSNPITGV